MGRPKSNKQKGKKKNYYFDHEIATYLESEKVENPGPFLCDLIRQKDKNFILWRIKRGA